MLKRLTSREKRVLQSNKLKLLLSYSLSFFFSPVQLIQCPTLCIYKALKCAFLFIPHPIQYLQLLMVRTPENSNSC